MNKGEIGGYMELEHFTGSEYYPQLYKVNLGRTAMLWLLRALPCRRLLLPYYICDTVTLAAQKAGYQTVSYRLDASLHPVWEGEASPQMGDVLYLVNYYGQLTQEQVMACRKQCEHIIVDNAQAFYDAPLPGVHTLYSCRKFFGLSDGAYVATDRPLPQLTQQDVSRQRMQHILGRWEDGATAHYQTMLSVAEGFGETPVCSMSAITENLLRAIDYEYVKRRRCENYRILQDLLPSENPFTRRMPVAPFAYPYYHPDGVRLRKALAQEKIYVPTNWSFLLQSVPEDWLEHDWSANVLPLPVDQRYGEEEMHRIAEVIGAYDRV